MRKAKQGRLPRNSKACGGHHNSASTVVALSTSTVAHARSAAIPAKPKHEQRHWTPKIPQQSQ